MKKCPMMFNLQFIVGGWKKPKDCIGAECAAYVERHMRYKAEYGGACMEKCDEWSCAMMPREVWHSGREANE